jgi:KUP system potassium uptake protein
VTPTPAAASISSDALPLTATVGGALRQPEEDLIQTAITRCHARLSGPAVFLASAANGVPLALSQFVKHNHVPYQRVVLVTVLIEEAPRIAPEDRAEIIEVVEGITRVILQYGFMHIQPSMTASGSPAAYRYSESACRRYR